MVKRKDPLMDKKEKVKKAGDAVRRVSKKLNFDEMLDVFTSDGKMLVPEKSEVFFERIKESRPEVCVGMIHTIYPSGGVDVWDETNQEFFLFNYKKHFGKVKVRAFELPTESPQPSPTNETEATASGEDEAHNVTLTKVSEALSKDAHEHLTAQELAEYLFDLLDDTYKRDVEEHLEKCTFCKELVENEKQRNPLLQKEATDGDGEDTRGEAAGQADMPVRDDD